MTVKNLKEILENVNDDLNVVICVNTPGGYVCPDGAVVDVNCAGQGIDWHGHDFVIHPKYKLNVDNIDAWVNRKD